MRYVELRRHTDNDGDKLSEQGVADAEAIGRTGLNPPYAAFISTGAERATEMLRILRRAAGQDEIPITTETGLRSVSRTGGAKPPRWPAGEPRSRRCARSTPILSSTRLSCSAQRFSGWSKACPRVVLACGEHHDGNRIADLWSGEQTGGLNPVEVRRSKRRPDCSSHDPPRSAGQPSSSRNIPT